MDEQERKHANLRGAQEERLRKPEIRTVEEMEAAETPFNPTTVGHLHARVEDWVAEEVICEWRDDEAWFVFRVAGQGKRQAAYPADQLLEMLQDLRVAPLHHPPASTAKVYGARHAR